MPENAKNTNSKQAPSRHNKVLFNSLFGVATAALVGIIVWALLSLFARPTLNEDFFVSNDTKSTITMAPEEGSNTSLKQTFVVYDYDGENVISMKTYFEYISPEAAKEAYEVKKALPEFANAELSDKYIIVTADPSSYQGLTASDIRQQEEAIKQFQASQKSQSEPKESEPKDSNSETSSSEDSEDSETKDSE